ncbi:hypothetical protein Forpe1208_v016045 [Fusarium oxysporum f. sp. rapae]|uniref:Uncharacterized protein n=1 Tax=Fusarium oxysporum f. sp. rapae TaxID=485398 RepID=A0A8J5NJP9_FUSOX|nr:hypothetical protein Forpe1208_v016045 [Fusarium oxysporum f. sp. rapae]
MKAEFQLELTKLSDCMAEEVARATAQMAQELSLESIEVNAEKPTSFIESEIALAPGCTKPFECLLVQELGQGLFKDGGTILSGLIQKNLSIKDTHR